MSILKKKKPWTSWPTCPVNNTKGWSEATLKVTVNIQIGPGEARGNKMVWRKKQTSHPNLPQKYTPNHFCFPKDLLKEK